MANQINLFPRASPNDPRLPAVLNAWEDGLPATSKEFTWFEACCGKDFGGGDRRDTAIDQREIWPIGSENIWTVGCGHAPSPVDLNFDASEPTGRNLLAAPHATRS